ncbi:MAG: YeeE/YedE thiosulfate transporter family protein [Pseudomonadota bacterium]
MEVSWLNALYGGLLIGLAAAVLLLTYGRILGVSGIIGGIVGGIGGFRKSEVFWRVMFVLGVLAGGFLGAHLWPDNFARIKTETDFLRLTLAGLLVGLGTSMGRGCTSGHGICGIGRLSPRSIVATCVFIATGMLTVAALGR